MNKIILFVVFLSVLSLFSVFSFAVVADHSFPQITEKPIIVIPGQDVFVSVYNGGHIVWTDTVLCVRSLSDSDVLSDSFCTTFTGWLVPEQFADVPLDLPLSFFLSADSFEASLFYDGTLLDSRVLPLHLVMPSATVVADDSFYLFFDPSSFDDEVVSLSVELSVLNAQGTLVFIDVYGPFYVQSDEVIVESFLVPDYLPLGELTLQSRFFSNGHMVEESFSTFEHTQHNSFLPVNAIFLMFFIMVFLATVYIVLDMAFYQHQLEDVIKRLRK